MEGGQILEQTTEMEGNYGSLVVLEMNSCHQSYDDEGDDSNSAPPEPFFPRLISVQDSLSYDLNQYSLETMDWRWSLQDYIDDLAFNYKGLMLRDEKDLSLTKVQRLASSIATANPRADCFELAQFIIKRDSGEVADRLLRHNNPEETSKGQIAAAKRQLNMEKYLLTLPERDTITKSKSSSKVRIDGNKPSSNKKSVSYDKKQLNYKRRL